nr:hypothetical protein [Candidatus Gracilibacteria bacterium]
MSVDIFTGEALFSRDLNNDGADIGIVLKTLKEDTSFLVESILKIGGEQLVSQLLNSRSLNKLLDWDLIKKSNRLNVKDNINSYLLQFSKFLAKNNYTKEYIDSFLKRLGTELFNSYIKFSLVDSGIKVPSEFVEVPDILKRQIYNILEGEEELAYLIIFLISCSFIELSENIGNRFEVESENKILEVDKDKLVADLLALGAIRTFEGRVEDDYFDFSDGRLDKVKGTGGGNRSFRIREKTDFTEGDVDLYYTIKRKKTEDTKTDFRECYEIEMRIKRHYGLLHILERFGLSKFREKAKDRISFTVYDKDDSELSVKFDIDDYGIVKVDGKEVFIPTILEIETNCEALANTYIRKLGFEGNVKLVTGSRGLFKYYANSQKATKKSKK